MQDLVGCRIVVPDIIEQEEYRKIILNHFPNAQLVDRLQKPQHGYRALHLILRNGKQRFEVQLRTKAQDDWANVVEKIADKVGLEVKYGGGSPSLQDSLQQLSGKIAKAEEIEKTYRVRLQNPRTNQLQWMRIWPELMIVSRNAIPLGSTILVELSEPSRAEIGSVVEWQPLYELVFLSDMAQPKPVTSPGAQPESEDTIGTKWGTLHRYGIVFENRDAAQAVESKAEDVNILYNEAQDMIEYIRRIFQ